ARAADPDLIVQNAVVVGSTARVLVKNQGLGPAVGMFAVRMDVFNRTTNAYLGSNSATVNGLPAGQSVWISITLSPPQPLSPNRKLIFRADSTGAITESVETNNTLTVLN